MQLQQPPLAAAPHASLHGPPHHAASAGGALTGGYPGAAADWSAAAAAGGGRRPVGGGGRAAASSGAVLQMRRQFSSRPSPPPPARGGLGGSPSPALLAPPAAAAAAAAAARGGAASPSAAPPAGGGGGGSGGGYGYAVLRQEGRGLTGARVTEGVRKLRYLHSELLADLHPGSARTFEFWVQLVLLVAALWLRVYLHYLGQYLFLKSLRVPVFSYDVLPYAATVKYVPDALPEEMELGVVATGPAFVVGAFAGLVALSASTQAVLGFFPHVASRFIAFFGVAAVLDPLLILLVDAIAGRYNCAARFAACALNAAATDCPCVEGDAWILYRRFQNDEGSGVVGAVLTALVYLVIMVRAAAHLQLLLLLLQLLPTSLPRPAPPLSLSQMLASVALYVFLLHVHLDGRMIDVYRRVHAPEDRFFVPHDFEVSAAELKWVVDRARRWRGARGSTRKVAVCDYVLTDPLDPAFKEVCWGAAETAPASPHCTAPPHLRSLRRRRRTSSSSMSATMARGSSTGTSCASPTASSSRCLAR